MDFKFPLATLSISSETWVALMKEPFTIYYNKKLCEFKNVGEGEKPSTGFRKLSVNQSVDISSRFLPELTQKQKREMGVDLAFLGFVQQVEYEGIVGKVHAFFAKIFNWIFRGSFMTSADRCKALAQDALGLSTLIINKECKKEFIGALKAYKRIYQVKGDPETCRLNECLGRWLVSKRSLQQIIKKVSQAKEIVDQPLHLSNQRI